MGNLVHRPSRASMHQHFGATPPQQLSQSPCRALERRMSLRRRTLAVVRGSDEVAAASHAGLNFAHERPKDLVRLSPRRQIEGARGSVAWTSCRRRGTAREPGDLREGSALPSARAPGARASGRSLERRARFGARYIRWPNAQTTWTRLIRTERTGFSVGPSNRQDDADVVRIGRGVRRTAVVAVVQIEPDEKIFPEFALDGDVEL
jgi:hypothetical protein